MDNVSHTLIGIGAYRLLPKKLQKPEVFWASVVGNNAPDSDVLQRFFPDQDDLAYLVHHRGYTHSLLFALPLGILVGGVANKIFGKPFRSSLGIWVGAGAAALHILADFMNDYGVHPFTPFLNRWFYGDSVFIVEPLLWFALIPVAILTVEKKWAKAAWGLIGAGMLVGIWFVPWLSFSFTAFLTVMGLALFFAVTNTKRAEFGIAAAMLTIGTFFCFSPVARSAVVKSWEHAHLTDEKILDVMSSASPGNPLCWKVWIRTENDSFWISRLATVSLLPSFIPPAECPTREFMPQKAPLTPNLLPSSAGTYWITQADLRKDLQAELIERSCRYRKLLNFARFPYVAPLGESGTQDGWIAGDLRFDRGKELGFADAVITLDDECSGSVDVWERPTDRRQ